MNKTCILIIDDEIQIRRFLKITLEANNYHVEEADSGKSGIIQAAMAKPELIILDLGLPDMDGLDVVRQIREWSKVPVIVLTVRNDESDKITLLDAGADDYLTKPFSTGELTARIKVALRHAVHETDSPVFINGSLTVDLSNRIVTLNREIIKLTATEYSLLKLFVLHAGKVLTHRQILKEIWGPSFVEDSQYLRVYMAALRKKLEENPTEPKIFLTESGVGYRMVRL